MALPKQVAKQLKDAEDLEKSLTAPTEPAPAAPVEPVVTEPSPPVDQAPAPQPTEPQPVVPTSPEPPKADDWEHKYKTLQGMFNRTVAQNQDLTAQIANLTAKLDALTKSPAAAPAAEVTPSKLVTDKDVETFGEDLLDVQRRVAREVASELMPEIEKLRAENAELKKMVTSTGTQVGELTFEQKLSRAVPDFDTINRDPRWFQWLDTVVEELGRPRREFAQTAFANGDVEALARFVAQFKKGLQPATTPDPRQQELQRQVQPARNNAQVTAPPAQGKIYTDAEAQQVFNRVRQLNTQGKFNEAIKLETEISVAYAEGRVQG